MNVINTNYGVKVQMDKNQKAILYEVRYAKYKWYLIQFLKGKKRVAINNEKIAKIRFNKLCR
jgi:hypothetical protein